LKFTAAIGNVRPRARTIIGPVQSVRPAEPINASVISASTRPRLSAQESSSELDDAEKSGLLAVPNSPGHRVVEIQAEGANSLVVTTKESDLFSPVRVLETD
jgi:hypothetical protein